MNPLLLETALKAALAASAFPTTTIYTGTSYDELTPETLNLIVSVDSLPHTAGGLYKGNVTFKVTAPALLGATSYAQMSDALAVLQNNLTAAYFTTNWPTAAGTPTFSGLWVEETKSSQHDHGWVAEITAIVGISL
jgi:hypothetical protein